MLCTCSAKVTQLWHHTCFDSWCRFRFQKDVSQEEATAVDWTESVGDSSAMLSDCPTVPLKVLHVHGYGEKLKPICIYRVRITLLINVVYCLCQWFLVLLVWNANAGCRNLQPVVTRQISKVGEMKTLGVGMLQMVTMSLIQLIFRSSNLH